MFNDLTNDNIELFAIKSYYKPNCVISEFNEDYMRINYLNRLFNRYKNLNDIRERLIINHLVILRNVFGSESLVRILFFTMPKHHYSVLKTYLLFLNIMPEKIRGISGNDIISSDIPLDMKIVAALRELK